MAQPNGPEIQALREERGMSRTQLGEKVGKSYQWVYNIENGHKGTKPETLYLLARILDVPVQRVWRSNQAGAA